MMEDEFDPHKPIYYGPSGSRKYKSGGTSEDIIILLVMLGLILGACHWVGCF